jgi:hypothetical protein
VADVVAHLDVNGPWQSRRSDVDDDPAVTAAVEHMTTAPTLAAAG